MSAFSTSDFGRAYLFSFWPFKWSCLSNRRTNFSLVLQRLLLHSQLDHFNKKDMGALMIPTSNWPRQRILPLFHAPLATFPLCQEPARRTERSDQLDLVNTAIKKGKKRPGYNLTNVPATLSSRVSRHMDVGLQYFMITGSTHFCAASIKHRTAASTVRLSTARHD